MQQTGKQCAERQIILIEMTKTKMPIISYRIPETINTKAVMPEFVGFGIRSIKLNMIKNGNQ